MSHSTTGTEETSLRIAVAICSVGRSGQLFEAVSWLTRQTKKPRQVVIVVTSTDDVPSRSAEIENLPLNFYFACSLATDQTVVASLKKAMSSLKKDGTYQALIDKWRQESPLVAFVE